MQHAEVTGGEYTRTVWRVPGPEDRLLVFLDAEFYLNRMDAAKIAAQWGTCLFVSHLNAEARHYDYTCNPNYARFIAEDVAEGREALIAGLSLSGLAAAHLALTYPGQFPQVLAQSGSFWWQNERLTEGAKPFKKAWFSVGDQETEKGIEHPPTGLRQDVTQVEAVERAAQAFGAHFHLYGGGHDPACWNEELPAALKWLITRSV